MCVCVCVCGSPVPPSNFEVPVKLYDILNQAYLGSACQKTISTRNVPALTCRCSTMIYNLLFSADSSVSRSQQLVVDISFFFFFFFCFFVFLFFVLFLLLSDWGKGGDIFIILRLLLCPGKIRPFVWHGGLQPSVVWLAWKQVCFDDSLCDWLKFFRTEPWHQRQNHCVLWTSIGCCVEEGWGSCSHQSEILPHRTVAPAAKSVCMDIYRMLCGGRMRILFTSVFSAGHELQWVCFVNYFVDSRN